MKVGALDQSYIAAKFSSRSELMLGSYDVPHSCKNQPKKQQRVIFSTKNVQTCVRGAGKVVAPGRGVERRFRKTVVEQNRTSRLSVGTIQKKRR